HRWPSSINQQEFYLLLLACLYPVSCKPVRKKINNYERQKKYLRLSFYKLLVEDVLQNKTG
ncbi:hypothetical protein ACVD09_26065, partial [Escherichia coli]